jgi:hypothetical protein
MSRALLDMDILSEIMKKKDLRVLARHPEPRISAGTGELAGVRLMSEGATEAHRLVRAPSCITSNSRCSF